MSQRTLDEAIEIGTYSKGCRTLDGEAARRSVAIQQTGKQVQVFDDDACIRRFATRENAIRWAQDYVQKRGGLVQGD